MSDRFLLNPDGTWPNGMTPERCAALDLIPVLPSPFPVVPGFVAIEEDPEWDGDVWRQVWRIEALPVPEADPEPPLPDLDRPQFAYLLGLGLGDVWTEVEARARAADREVYAQLKEARERPSFNFETTLAMIEQFRPFVPEGVDLSREALSVVWRKAASRGPSSVDGLTA